MFAILFLAVSRVATRSASTGDCGVCAGDFGGRGGGGFRFAGNEISGSPVTHNLYFNYQLGSIICTLLRFLVNFYQAYVDNQIF